MGLILCLCWAVTILSVCVGASTMLSGLANANGSPQQAAAAAVGVAFAVIPYCFTRALSEINREVRADKTQQSPGVRPEREEVELSAPVQSTPALQETSWDDPSG